MLLMDWNTLNNICESFDCINNTFDLHEILIASTIILMNSTTLMKSLRYLNYILMNVCKNFSEIMNNIFERRSNIFCSDSFFTFNETSVIFYCHDSRLNLWVDRQENFWCPFLLWKARFLDRWYCILTTQVWDYFWL